MTCSDPAPVRSRPAARNDSICVPTNALADALAPAIEAQRRRFIRENGYSVLPGETVAEAARRAVTWGTYTSPMASVINDVRRTLDVSEDAVYRRLWNIEARESASTGLRLAEAFLDAFDVPLVDIPVLPRTLTGAREMVDAWMEDLSPLERGRFARTLWNFSMAYINESADPETKERQRKNAQQKTEAKRKQAVAA